MTIADVLEVWGGGTVGTLALALAVSVLGTYDGRPGVARSGARLAFLCWAWPAMLAVLAGYSVLQLWRTADWKTLIGTIRRSNQ